MQPIVVSVGPLAGASANNICLSQTPSAGALTLNGALASGGVATLDKPRQILFTFAADESGHNFVVTGTNWSGLKISETVAGTTAGTKATVLSYATVTSITIDTNATGAITVGTNGVADSPWVRLDGWANPSLAKACVTSGTVNYTVQFSMDDPNSPTNAVTPAEMTWNSDSDTNFVNATGTKAGSWAYIPVWARILLNSGSGTVTMTVQQTGVAPY